MTKLEGKEGEKIFGDNITITEDPFHENAIVKTSFDDEGFPCSKKNIVENGVFTTFLYLSFNVGYISFLYFLEVVNSSKTSTVKPFFLKKSNKLLIKLVLPVLGVPQQMVAKY